ncbi:MAG: DUF4956 domain-containing protein [Isosphaeraceae bacterium]
MPEWLSPAVAGAPGADLGTLFWRLGVAALLGLAVTGLYRWARRGESAPANLATTLVLLSVVIAMATQVIGDNVARAFSLVGALSVVRFRTVVKDTQDTAFVIFAVVVGMAAGADHLAVALVGLVVLGVASVGLWPPRRPGVWVKSAGTLTVRVALADEVRAALEQRIAGLTERFEPIAASTARQGAALDLSYRLRIRSDCPPVNLVAELNQLEGVESVDLKSDE